MVREFELPDVGEGVAEGEIVDWLVEEGDPVEEDQPVAEVETDKAVVDVPSPVNGSVQEIHAAAGEMVPVGTVIITFAEEGDESDEGTSREEPAECGPTPRRRRVPIRTARAKQERPKRHRPRAGASSLHRARGGWRANSASISEASTAPDPAVE